LIRAFKERMETGIAATEIALTNIQVEKLQSFLNDAIDIVSRPLGSSVEPSLVEGESDLATSFESTHPVASQISSSAAQSQPSLYPAPNMPQTSPGVSSLTEGYEIIPNGIIEGESEGMPNIDSSTGK
jgi:hypothetical protein